MNKLSQQQVAHRVNWYASPESVVASPDRFLAQIMARGNADDICHMRDNYSPEDQQRAYLGTPAGMFDQRSWAYWGLLLFNDPRAYPFPERFSDASGLQWRG